jgi:FkbM family methyltransferase
MLTPPDLLSAPGFRATALAQTLLAEPLRLIDIGARDGVHDTFLALGKLARVLAFEPDAEGFQALVADQTLANRLAEAIIRPEALGDGTRRPFHLMSKPTNHSLLRTNDTLVDRYRMELFRNVGSFEIDTHRLDDIVAGPAPGFGEIVKIDTQASEHLILSHAPTMLRDTTVAVVAEVWFCEIYEGQPLFHDLCQLLAGFGLGFYGFTSFFLRSGKRLDKRRFLGRERALYADAVFLRDPFDQADPIVSDRQRAVLFVAACATGYFDLALEVAATLPDAAALRASVHHCAAVDAAGLLATARAALAAAETPDDTMVALGRFADRWRSTFDYGDVI